MKHNWGLVIREMREARLMTQQELADGCGVDRGYISRIEAGKFKHPSPTQLPRLAKALKIPISMLAVECYRDNSEYLLKLPIVEPKKKTRCPHCGMVSVVENHA